MKIGKLIKNVDQEHGYFIKYPCEIIKTDNWLDHKNNCSTNS